MSVNHEVSKAVQMLMNARARSEAMRRMDAGDYVGSQQVLACARAASVVAFSPMASAPDVQEEMQRLCDLDEAMLKPEQAKMTRKRLMYDIFSRRRSQKLS
jgi:hypothetical protein